MTKVAKEVAKVGMKDLRASIQQMAEKQEQFFMEQKEAINELKKTVEKQDQIIIGQEKAIKKMAETVELSYCLCLWL